MKKSNIPMRKCVGCNESKPQNQLTRIACYEGVLTVDYSGRAKGRGIYLCNDRQCILNARKRKAIVRGFKGAVTVNDADNVLDQMMKNLGGKADD